MSEVIVVTSGKGGVGKTTTTANIGTGLAKLGKKVVMIDTDTGLRNLDVVLGLENRIVYNLVDVVEGNCRIKQALITDKRCPKLYLLPTAQTRDKSAVTPGSKLTRAVSDSVSIPVIASGGVGNLQHLVDGIVEGHADAVLAASIFHFGEYTIEEAKRYMQERGIPVRLD